MRLLLAEDDQKLADNLSGQLRQQGYVVDHSSDGRDAQFLGDNNDYDIIILDLGLPIINGLDVLQHWRQHDINTPVLILTARDSWHEKVTGLKGGADDYLTKPFHVEELLARLQALIRRSHGTASDELRSGELLLDESHQQVLINDQTPIDLTGTEFRLLRYFMLNQGKLLSKTRLTEHVYDQDFDRDSNLIEVYVRRLRDKIGRDYIQTRRGQGYVFDIPQ
ncbi:MAG: response regulator transcription factor [Chromatiales bacterium]|jgi:DNA-binding response OmpR family regulator